MLTSVTTSGGLLPPDVLERIAAGIDVPGSAPADYHLGAHESVRDAAERSWTYLLGVWKAFSDELAARGAADNPDDPATALTRDRWLHLLFRELGYGRLPTVPAGGLSVGEQRFPVSHHWANVPVHMLGWNTRLDVRTAGVAGAAGTAPQAMLQEYLNRSQTALWGFLTNGRLLRVLRDSTAMVGSAYVEFDLAAIFDGELFSEFVLLFRLAHQSRVETRDDAAGPASCWLEKWHEEARDSGTRALKELRKGVERALSRLGTGFLRHPDNTGLRRRLADRDVPIEDMQRALLRLAYRLLFLFVAEARGALHPTGTAEHIRERYRRYFSTARLRRTAARRTGGPHDDQWRALCLVLDGLGREDGLPELGLPGLGGVFEETEADRILAGCAIANEDLFAAVRALSVVRDPAANRNRLVDYRHLGAEELGSVYEALLELIPRHDPDTRTFELVTRPGNERKTTGSYYTPAPLIESLLDSALDPVLDDAMRSAATREDQAAALLRVTVCDPACGSGHFLVAAARRIAKRLAAVRTGEPHPGSEDVRTALREVVGRCVYGVDLNPMAVELAKVSLWLEALEPGKPLNFLDAHIKHGNALLGTTPSLLVGGLPDAAFKPIEGDDRKWASALKRRNKDEREAYLDSRRLGDAASVQDALFGRPDLLEAPNIQLAEQAAQITAAGDDTLSEVHAQRDRYRELVTSAGYLEARELADAWCAAFVWRKMPVDPTDRNAPKAPTTQNLLDLHNAPETVEPATRAEIRRLREQYGFFHWHLEFPEVFGTEKGEAADEPGFPESGRRENGQKEQADGLEGPRRLRPGWTGGFSCVLGNPPWERVKLQEQEFFAARREEIAAAPNKAARQRMIESLADSAEPADRALAHRFSEAKREAEGISHLLRDSSHFPLAGKGDVNTYAVFAETASQIVDDRGFFGLVLPTGIATDATTAPFFSDLVRNGRLASFLDFENEAFLLSRDVHHSVRFCLLAAAGLGRRVESAEFAFSTRYMADLPARRFLMPPEEILLVNPNTKTLPVFRSRRDAEIVLGIYRRFPVLIREGDPEGNPWGLSFGTMFHMSNDSHLFRTAEQLEAEGWELHGNVYVRGEERMLPLYEAKMLHHFDHRLGTYDGQTQAQANVGTLPRLTPEQHDDPAFMAMPRYWVPEDDVPTGEQDSKGNPVHFAGLRTRLAKKKWPSEWLLGWRDVARSTDERTLISTFLPLVGVGHKFPLMLARNHSWFLCALLSSFALDYIIRQKFTGTSITYSYIAQLPFPDPNHLKNRPENHPGAPQWLRRRVIELSYTTNDMRAFAQELGDRGEPFRWDEQRRSAIRAELDAAIFHLYEVKREDVDFIMDTFQTTKRRELANRGTFYTKSLILSFYDAMTEARDTNRPYQTSISPPPGEGPRHPATSS
ncbi:Eco57I restriction-modification methylase domain-containing protein [Streptomonospora nanhaiensis]|uniref:Eco57I restriction-modification methylase domain-containing protein n=1 Tax=Streptomonospora nanhaiensis TaxID=1323731 RepID=UPI0036DE77B9